MIYEIKMPDLSKLTMEDEIEFDGQTHVPTVSGRRIVSCSQCSLTLLCNELEAPPCASIHPHARFKLK